MQPILHRQPREPAPPSQMNRLCSSALRTTLGPGQRSRGEEWPGFWPKWPEPSTPCSSASQPSQAGWS
eukprot:6008855-Alexandrium_andersonii.AAC.1